MSKEAQQVYDVLLMYERGSNSKDIQGYLSAFPQNLRSSIIDLFEELVSEDKICLYSISTGYEWTCCMK